MSEDDEFADRLRARALEAFGLKPWDAGLASVPLRVRLWRTVTVAKRRGKVIDWRSYNAAEADYRARREAFTDALPDRMQAIADQFSEGLPDGLRFEWQVPGAGDCEAVAADMGIDPAAPMTRQQHAVFVRRMDERLARRSREGS